MSFEKRKQNSYTSRVTKEEYEQHGQARLGDGADPMAMMMLEKIAMWYARKAVVVAP